MGFSSRIRRGSIGARQKNRSVRATYCRKPDGTINIPLCVQEPHKGFDAPKVGVSRGRLDTAFLQRYEVGVNPLMEIRELDISC